MSRSRPFDSHAARDVNPRGKLAERDDGSPDRLCRDAASLLETLNPKNSEAHRMAERLRLLAKAIVRAMAADSTERRQQADFIFGAESQVKDSRR